MAKKEVKQLDENESLNDEELDSVVGGAMKMTVGNIPDGGSVGNSSTLKSQPSQTVVNQKKSLATLIYEERDNNSKTKKTFL